MRIDDYPIVVRRIQNGFSVEAVDFGLIRTGSDIQALEADIRAAVDDILVACERHGAKIGAPINAKIAEFPASYRPLIVRAMFVLLIIVIVTMPLLWGFQKVAAVMAASIEKVNAAQIERMLSSGVERAATSLEAITPERRDQLSHDLGRIARVLEPYAAELRPLLIPLTPLPPVTSGK